MNIKDVLLGFKRNETVHCSLVYKPGEENEYTYFKRLKLNNNTNTKVIVHCSEAERKLVPESVLREFVGDSKIVYEIQKTTNVRSRKITEVKTNQDKFIEYLKVNEIECTDSLLGKLKELEDNLDIKSSVKANSFTLLKMSLRGAIGVKEGTGKDEVEIDLANYTDGLIALTGSNGSGKSTCIENCHPYPRLLTRTGKLQDHFFLKDSHRKLLYIDSNGVYYSIEILIDGKLSSGKVKCTVSTGTDINNLTPIPQCDGNASAYEQWVDDTFGPIELFLRTCFFAKEATKGIPDISETTKGQKKELFTSLIGIDGLDSISVASKSKANELASRITKLEAKFDDIDFDSIEKEYKKIITNENELLNNYKEHKASLRKVIKEAEATKNDLETKVPNTDTLDRMKEMMASMNSQKKTIDSYEEKAAEYESIRFEFSKAEELNERVMELKADYMSKEMNLTKLKAKLSELKSSSKSMSSNIKAYTASHFLDLKTPKCPTCGKALSEHKAEELHKQAKYNRVELRRFERELDALNEEITNLEPQIEEAKLIYEESCNMFKSTNNELIEQNKKLKNYNLKQLDKLDAEYNFIKSQYDSSKHEKLAADIKTLDKAIKERMESIGPELEKVTKILSESESELTTVEFEMNSVISKISSYETKLDILKEDKAHQEMYRKEHKELVIDKEQYDIITVAFSKNGIQALELEALAPDIAGITNSILSSAYGDRFKISFETLRTGSSGQLIEDFSILVEDTSTGTVRPLEWLSSGEAVWIKEALYNAFTIERQRTTGFTFRTRFLDESDGSLDSSARMKYLNMIESAHKEGGVNHTIIITHSQELKDLIPQQINTANL